MWKKYRIYIILCVLSVIYVYQKNPMKLMHIINFTNKKEIDIVDLIM